MEALPDRPRGIQVPISIGELVDKISILEIKAERISDHAKLVNIHNELRILNEVKRTAGLDNAEIRRFAEEIKAANMELWDTENEIRELEARQDFGGRFIVLARKVYLTNDRRARIKQNINVKYLSEIVEEKSYHGS